MEHTEHTNNSYNLRKESSVVLYIYFEVRGSVSSKKSKHIHLSKAPNWIGPCQVCPGQRASREQRQCFGAVAIKIKMTTMDGMQRGKRLVDYRSSEKLTLT